jgi:hypothetical protein
MTKKKTTTPNNQAQRIGAVTDEECRAAAPAYARHCKTCQKYGLTPETAARFLGEFVEDFRAKAVETPEVEVGQMELGRDYSRQFDGRGGHDSI